jgi:hypothetical protein
VPAIAIAEESLAFLHGALKYGRANWRATGVKASTYLGAHDRHMKAYAEGEDLDDESRISHLAHARACLAILIDAKAAGVLVDDRNFLGAGYRPAIKRLTPMVAWLKGKFADRNPRHYTIADNAEFGVGDLDHEF